MQFKNSISALVLLMICIGANAQTNDSTRVAEHFDRMSKQFAAGTTVAIDMEMRLFDIGAIEPTQTFQNKIYQQGNLSWIKQFNQEFVVSQSLMVQVDHDYQEMIVSKRNETTEKQTQGLGITQYFSGYEEVKLESAGKSDRITLQFVPEVLYDFAELLVDRNTSQPQVLILWSKPDDFGRRAKVEVHYQRIDFAPSFSPGTFSANKYITAKAKGYQPSAAYSNYFLTDAHPE